MLFNSLPFLLFLPAVVLGYVLTPRKWRWVLLLLASYVFYGYWKVEYLALILISTTVDFIAAQKIYSSQNSFSKRAWLTLSLATNIGLLLIFKYANWFISDLWFPLTGASEETIEGFQSVWTLMLPVGISFYTFQTIGYTLDIYGGKATPEKNPLKFALFVSYFPQLVAGPIERFSHLHPQLFNGHKLSYRNLQHGLRLVLYGLFIKMCVADNLAPIVDQVFGHVDEASRLNLITGAILFGLQIYADFHGYSLIAIGTARIFGVHLMDNFNAPYTATSIREFWSRWHISLSTWFRDYLYIPLGGSRTNQLRLAANILIVFLVSGIWHGANLTFLIWGLLHGVAYLLERWFIERDTSYWLNFPKWFGTMTIVFIAWIFFRSANLTEAATFVHQLVSGEGAGIDLNWPSVNTALVGIFVLSDLHFRDRGIDAWLGKKSIVIRWAVYAFLIYCITSLAGATNHPFIYFQF